MTTIQNVPNVLTENTEKKAVHIDEKDFSDQFKKFTELNEQESSQSLESKSETKEENKEEPREEDVPAFTLVNPFLHIDFDFRKLPEEIRLPGTGIEVEKAGIPDIELGELATDEIPNLVSQPVVGDTEQVEFTDLLEELPRQANLIQELVLTDVSDLQEVKSSVATLDVETSKQVDSQETVSEPIQTTKQAETDDNLTKLEAFKLSDQIESTIEEPIEAVKEPVKQVTVQDSKPEETQEFESNQLVLTDLPEIKELSEQPTPFIEVITQPNPVTREEGIELIKEMVIEKIMDESGTETTRSTLRLTPDSLGEVKIELLSTKEGLSGKMIFQSEETKQWMEKEWRHIRLPLETKGVTLGNIEFTVSQPEQMQLGDFNFSQNLAQSEQEDSPKKQTFQDNRTSDSHPGEEETLEPISNQRSGLNVYV